MEDDCDNILKSMKDEPVTLLELRELCLLPSQKLDNLLKCLEAEGKVCSNTIVEAGITMYWTPQLFCAKQEAGTISQVTPGPIKSRTPLNDRCSVKLRQPFKSPLQSHQPTPVTYEKESLEKEMANLKLKLDKLNDEIEQLQKEYHEDELQEHIDKLHEYNEIKDVGQLLIGKLAEISGTTTKSMYDDFGLDLED